MFMHELGITKTIIDLLQDECSKRDITCLKSVTIELGQLSTYTADSIKFYFETIKKDYPNIKNTDLNFIEIKGALRCMDCNAISEITDNTTIFCPACSSVNIEIFQGKDVNIKEIGVD